MFAHGQFSCPAPFVHGFPWCHCPTQDLAVERPPWSVFLMVSAPAPCPRLELRPWLLGHRGWRLHVVFCSKVYYCRPLALAFLELTVVRRFHEYTHQPHVPPGLRAVLGRLSALYALWSLSQHTALLYQGEAPMEGTCLPSQPHLIPPWIPAASSSGGLAFLLSPYLHCFP